MSAIPPSIAAKTGIKSGVIITSVRPGSFADEIGLGKTQIITAINRKPVTDEASYRAIVSTLKSRTTLSSSSRYLVRKTSTPTLVEHSRRLNWVIDGRERHTWVSLLSTRP